MFLLFADFWRYFDFSGSIGGATFADDTREDVRAVDGDVTDIDEAQSPARGRERLNSTGPGIAFQEFISLDRKSR